MAPVVDIAQLQDVVGRYADQHKLIAAAGPFTAAALTRAFVTKNKLVTGAMVAGGTYMAVQEVGGPMLKLMQDQFGYLQALVGLVR